MKKIRIANGQGFWGDNVDIPLLMLEEKIDYIGMDYLAEVTLSIMMRQKLKNPRAGYARDFLDFIRRGLEKLVTKNVKVITNAGGLSPEILAEEIIAIAKSKGIRGLKVATVTGDNLYPLIDELIESGISLQNMETGEEFAKIRDKITSINAYLGAKPVVEALKAGAQIVIAGRITDTALVSAPVIYEFQVDWQDWDRIASATVGGHIVECGAQATGGNYSRWWEVPDMWDVGYPILEFYPDGSFIVTKSPKRGGVVNKFTVAEQLLYEMGDPTNYITPDCIADFSTIQLREIGKDKVLVEGIKGKARTQYLKVAATYLKGYKAVGQLVISGPRALEKAQLAAEIVWKRLERSGYQIAEEEKFVEFLGTGATLPTKFRIKDPPEVVVRIGIKSSNKEKVERFGKEIAPLVTSGPPGVTGFSGGRPKPQEMVAYWPTLVPRQIIEDKIEVKIEVS